MLKNVIKTYIESRVGKALYIQRDLLPDEKILVSMTFSYIEHDSIYKFEFDGSIFLTDRRFLIRPVKGDNLDLNLEDITIVVVNFKNLFLNGVRQKFTVDRRRDSYLQLQTKGSVYSFWLREHVANPGSGMPGLDMYSGDNRYLGLYLIVRSLKDKHNATLQESIDIYYYKDKERSALFLILSLALLPISVLIGLVLSLITNKMAFLGLGFACGIPITIVLFLFSLIKALQGKRSYDQELRTLACKTFNI